MVRPHPGQSIECLPHRVVQVRIHAAGHVVVPDMDFARLEVDLVTALTIKGAGQLAADVLRPVTEKPRARE